MTALRVLFGLVAFSIAAALHVYMWRRLVRDPGWSPRVRRVLTTVIVVMGLGMLTMMALSRQIHREVVWPVPLLTWSWLGALFYLLLFTGVTEAKSLPTARHSSNVLVRCFHGEGEGLGEGRGS